MLHITKCQKQDLIAINDLLSKYNFDALTPDHINRRDITLQARLSTGELVGFVACGLMCNKTWAYVYSLAVDPEHIKHGIVNKMYQYLLKELDEVGCKQVFGTIRHDQYHNAAAVNALKMGLGAHPENFTFVFASLSHMKNVLGLEK